MGLLVPFRLIVRFGSLASYRECSYFRYDLSFGHASECRGRSAGMTRLTTGHVVKLPELAAARDVRP